MQNLIIMNSPKTAKGINIPRSLIPDPAEGAQSHDGKSINII